MSLVADDIEVRFGGLTALRGVGLELSAGSVTALIGPNGAGKTTLLNCISGFVEATRGSIAVDAVDVTRMPPEARVRFGLRRSFQTPRVEGDATVWDNLFVGCHPRSRTTLWRALLRTRVERRERRCFGARTFELIRRFGFEGVADLPAGELSTGQLRRLELARCMAMQPRFVLLDEPAAGLDAGERGLLAESIAELAGEGVTVLLVEHNFGFVKAVSDTVTVLANGEHLVSGAPPTVERDPRVVDAYLGVASDAG